MTTMSRSQEEAAASAAKEACMAMTKQQRDDVIMALTSIIMYYNRNGWRMLRRPFGRPVPIEKRHLAIRAWADFDPNQYGTTRST
jgi:hypothetical protein